MTNVDLQSLHAVGPTLVHTYLPVYHLECDVCMSNCGARVSRTSQHVSRVMLCCAVRVMRVYCDPSLSLPVPPAR